ncbi:unnamed protein product [Rotaria sordida]|uniref:F-box domain-containing protein n=1 Tax=Rotaria sordida TaxID=392033 RepID=A0A815RQX2_9BILA|nr:unnamed protein product [Rotaria sordida]CAF3873264.1 unnamed protein product [Rotaria sordida]
MSEIKRKLNSDDLSEEKPKKFRNKFDQLMTCFEDLSNELLCEIFDYLDGYRLCKAFSNLNSRFEQLLHSSSVLLKIRYFLIELDQFINKFKQFMFSNRHQIFSIHIDFVFEYSNCFSSFLFDSSFDRLESIIFKHIQSGTLIPILSNLSSLPRLSSLTIERLKVKEKINDIHRLVFVLPKLKYYRISSCDTHHSIILPMAMNNQYSPIEYFVIDHYCSLNELTFLISYTPKLRRLTVHKIKTNDSNITILSSMILANLNSIYLDLHQTTFNVLETFITKKFPNLKSLFIASSNDITFLHAYRWEQLILKNFPQLEKFYFIYDDLLDNEEKYPRFTGRSNQFSSSFWIERQWLFEAEIKDTDIEYTIRSYSKRWYDDMEDNIVNRYVKYSTFTNLTFEYITTLKIHSLSIDETTELTLKELLILCSIKGTSKITKVYLEEIDDVKELDFLFTLCPYMEYFKIRCINTVDIQSYLRTIFKIIKQNNNHHLHSLCFPVQTADEQIVKNIERMINYEKLLSNFTVKHILDTVYLRWK